MPIFACRSGRQKLPKALCISPKKQTDIAAWGLSFVAAAFAVSIFGSWAAYKAAKHARVSAEAGIASAEQARLSVKAALDAVEVARDLGRQSVDAAAEANRIAELSTIMENRPWITLQVGVPDAIRSHKNQYAIDFECKIINSGKTPAVNLNIYNRILICADTQSIEDCIRECKINSRIFTKFPDSVTVFPGEGIIKTSTGRFSLKDIEGSGLYINSEIILPDVVISVSYKYMDRDDIYNLTRTFGLAWDPDANRGIVPIRPSHPEFSTRRVYLYPRGQDSIT